MEIRTEQEGKWISPALLKGCKIWARVSNNTESYTGNNYVRG